MLFSIQLITLSNCSKPTTVTPQVKEEVNIEETCIEAYGTVVPMDYMAGEVQVGNTLLRNNMWGIRGHAIDTFKQCIFTKGDEFGWSWRKGKTDTTCQAPVGYNCEIPCMYQFTFGQLDYGIGPWGISSGAKDMPVKLSDLDSLLISHDITYEAFDDAPGNPGSIYARHSMIYDLHLTSIEPIEGMNIEDSIIDEVIIMMNYNPEYPDLEACSHTKGPSIEINAVFDGFHHYNYHSVSGNVIGQYYHQFRRVDGDVQGISVPKNVDLMPFINYLISNYNRPELWLGKVSIGTQLYDHTHGKVTFHSSPTFNPVYK